MARALYPPAQYPDGHPQLVKCLEHLGDQLHSSGASLEALPHLREAALMHSALSRRQLLTSGEGDSLARVRIGAAAQSGYLAVSAAAGVPAAETYEVVWPMRGLVPRLLELRHAAGRTTDPHVAARLEHLRELRRRIEQLLIASAAAQHDRDVAVAKLNAERDDVERRLAAEIPILERWREQDRRRPHDLAKALGAAAFVDIVQYQRYNPERTRGRTVAHWYTAFIVSASGGVTRAELGPAEPINSALAAWRSAIARKSDDGGAEVTRLVWAPIARQLPPATTAVYIAADGELARLPWAALPTGQGRVLLEDRAVAVVPNGAYLLEHLQTKPAQTDAPAILALGGVSYAPPWPALPGTTAELAVLAKLAPTPPLALTQSQASARALTEALIQVRYAHLSTHGYFKLRNSPGRGNVNRLRTRAGGKARRTSASALPRTRLAMWASSSPTGMSCPGFPCSILISRS
jgi:hypothetical protein